MFLKLVFMLFFLVTLVASEDNSFIYNNRGFQSFHLYLDGIAELTSGGLPRLTNDTKQYKGHALYPKPIVFKNTSSESVSSFSTTFLFAIKSPDPELTLSGHGIVLLFQLSPTKGQPNSLPGQYLGLFNNSNNGNSSNHVFGVHHTYSESQYVTSLYI
ncbi:putative non-specific serine/threonine protein kinase [Medicago truncatula]|uniref:Legume lectin beta domain protein n=1 Tax=Medicago truncatula TaxID=3880 RepID=A0A072U0M7_MEDTR|nr:legume lectin beta domain protein [Medicago truncatula]RHN46164.1 putative non-specific serine/threonine protein kinase [Medicago truncatula]